jgi:hypothetical protein
MRSAYCLGILMLFAACTAARSGDQPVEMTVIASGAYASAETRTAVVAASAGEYQRVWRESIGNGEGAAPDADLATGTVIFLFAGTRNTGGWSIEPQAVSIGADGIADVVAAVEGPRAGGIVTQALTSPYAVLLVRDRSIKGVRWAQ